MSIDLLSRMFGKKRVIHKIGRSAMMILLAAFLWVNLLPANAATTVAPARILSLDDRLACATVVEDFYWQQRIWPESNPGLKPRLTDVMSPADIAASTDETLAQSLALEQYWQTPITGSMLQSELDRMAANSRQPAVLKSLYAALENDPALAAECLARPVLAERLLHERFENDDRFAGLAFAEWWEDNRPNTAAFEIPAYSYQLPPVSEAFGNDDSWKDTASIPLDNIDGDVVGAAVWTGTEMVFIGDFSREAFLYNPATDSWQTASTLGGPLGLRKMSAVWTGTYVVASNGCTANNDNCTVSLAWRYDPQVDFWEPIPNAPISRTDQSALWTGTEMIVWGGCNYFNDICSTHSQLGARYNPGTNSWQTMSTTNAPLGRSFPNLVWTGTEMIVWGGHTGNPDDGGRYDPATDSWSAVSTTNAPVGAHSSAVWSGSEMVAWGGCTGSPMCNTPNGDGASYDPATDTWTAISSTGAPEARFDHEAVWIGDAMIVWGGYDGSNYLNSGSRYDPATDTWTAISSSDAPSGRIYHKMLWTDSLVLVWGGTGISDMRTGGRYNPISDSWTAINTEDPNSFRTYHMAVWTGAEMIVWGGIGDGNSATSGLNTGRRYDPATDNWSSISNAGAPPGAWDGSIVWTGSEMIVFGGQSGTTVRTTGGMYNPMTDSWMAMATHLGHTDGAYVWTGSEMLVWGGIDSNGSYSNAGALFNPVTNSWTDITTIGAPSARQLTSGFVWSGEEMLVWGGFDFTGELGTGGRYDPDTDTWSPISNVNAPEARNLHVAVWTGSEMIVWGGVSDYSPFTPLDTGGRYDPATDSWTATSTTGTPIPAARPQAVWSGSEMIVWGGECDVTDITCHMDSYQGGRYDPNTDSWMLTTLDGVPEARSYHTAVWTGDAMIVYGGTGTWSGFRHTGGLYYASAPANQPPIANDDSYSAVENETLIVPAPGVLDNDTDPDGNNLSAVLDTTTTNGSLVLNGDGSFTYIPDLDFIGSDSFTYHVFDGLDNSNTATVTITVTQTPPTGQFTIFMPAVLK